MPVALKLEGSWTADEFLVTDQQAFGDAWRYELVDGRVLAHAAPTPEHGAIVAGLTGALGRRLVGMPGGCRPETGSAAAPRSSQRNTARIPDVILRCGEHPRVAFEAISPSEIKDWRARDLKRQHLQAVEGIREIVELFQDDHAAHVYRLASGASWTFEALGGAEAVLRLESVGIEVPMGEIYAFAAISLRSRGPERVCLTRATTALRAAQARRRSPVGTARPFRTEAHRVQRPGAATPRTARLPISAGPAATPRS